jgi:hypothetical protein
MAKRVLLSAVIVAALMVTIGAGSTMARYYHATGRVIVPDGDLLEGIAVNFYVCYGSCFWWSASFRGRHPGDTLGL